MVLPTHPTYGTCHGEYRFCIRGTPQELEDYKPYIGADQDGSHQRSIGIFSLYEKILLFHCSCRPAFDVGRRFLETQFRDPLQFAYEDILDVTNHLERQAPTFGVRPLPIAMVDAPPARTASRPRMIPPKGLAELAGANPDLRPLIREHHARTFADFLDEPHFLLDDQTPRDAARSEDGRPQLIELMKITLYEIDIRNRQFQSDLNIDAILRELGLAELIEVSS